MPRPSSSCRANELLGSDLAVMMTSASWYEKPQQAHALQALKLGTHGHSVGILMQSLSCMRGRTYTRRQWHEDHGPFPNGCTSCTGRVHPAKAVLSGQIMPAPDATLLYINNNTTKAY